MLSSEQLTEAQEKQNFLWMKEDKFIKIIHMPKLWSEQPDLKLLVSERLVGTDEELSILNKYDPAATITSFNFDTTKYDAYQALVDQYNVWIKDTLKTAIKAPGHKLTSGDLPEEKSKGSRKNVEDIEDIEDGEEINENDALIGSELDERVPVKLVTKTIKRPKKPINLQLKIDKLEEGKIIDVSNMNEYGVGIKTAVYNKTKHNNKYHLKNKTIMSDNYKSLLNALGLVKGGREKYIKDIRKAEKFFNVEDAYVEEVTKTVKTPNKKTPKKSKYDKYKTELSGESTESEPEMEVTKRKRTPKAKVVSESDGSTESEPETIIVKTKKVTPKKRTPKAKVSESESIESEPEMIKTKKATPKKRIPKAKDSESTESEPEPIKTKKATPKTVTKKRTPKAKKI